MINPKLSHKKILEKKDFLPFYLYDYETIKGQILKLKKYLPLNVKVYYSVKANPNIAILKIMKNFGLGAEIISCGELLACQKAGFKPDEIIFAGSAKSDEELLAFARQDISLISLESVSEIQRLNKLTENIKKRQAVIIRLASVMPRAISYYGFQLNEIEEILNGFSRKYPALHLKGIHFYNNSRIYDANVLIGSINQFFLWVCEIEKKHNLNFEVLDIGGGFGANAKRELAMEIFGKGLSGLIKKHHLGGRKILLELGRFLVNNAGFYLSRIIETREEANTNYLVVEGISNHLKKRIVIDGLKNTSFIFRDRADDFAYEILPRRRGKIYPTVIRGQLSSISGVFGGSIACKLMLPKKIKAGDFLIITGVGAYGLTQAEMLFGSQPTAVEFLLIDGKLELIRDKGKPEDFLLHQKIPVDLLK